MEKELNTTEVPPHPPPEPPPLPSQWMSGSPVKLTQLPPSKTNYQGVKRQQKEKQFRLVGAIEQRDLQKIRQLIEDGVDINCTILYAKTPLIHAVEQCYEDVAELLIESGAKLEKSEMIAWQRRPLHMAVQSCSMVLVEKLLSKGALVDGQDGCGMTPLHHACHLGHKEIVEVLLEHGACTTKGDYVERDALHRAVEGGHLEIAELLLLDKKMLVNGADKFGWTSLFQCIMWDDFEGAEFLIQRGADVNLKDNKGDTPLHIACDRLSKANMRTMLATSVDFYRRMRRIPTSDIQRLLNSDRRVNFEMVELLVNSGADVNAENDFMTRVVHMTREPHVLRFLILCGAHIDYDMVLWSHVLEEDHNALCWLEDEFTMQTTLRRICRGAVRRHLGHTRNIKEATTRLPLPSKLIDYLNLNDMD